MERLLPQNGLDPKALSSLDLAFVGDAVYDLLAREYLAAGGSCPVKKLHQLLHPVCFLSAHKSLSTPASLIVLFLRFSYYQALY